MGGSVEVRLLGPRIPPEGGDRGLPEAGSSPLLSVVILGHWVIVSSCAFVVDRRPLLEHSSSKYTQAWEAVHLKRSVDTWTDDLFRQPLADVDL